MADNYTKWDLDWKCSICGVPAKDTVALFEQYFSSVRRVKIFKDSDNVDWVLCSHCSSWYHWVCVISMSTTDKELLFPFLCAKCMQKGCIKLEN